MPDDVHEIISYSSDFITSIRNDVNGISKKVRKQLFVSRIWEPRSIQHREKNIVNSYILSAKQMLELCFLEYSISEKQNHMFI